MGLFELLRDPAGEPYDRVPCQDRPHLFDVGAGQLEQERAAAICRDCPALAPCAHRAHALGDQAEGTWAGVYRGHGPSRTSTIDDPLVVGWAAKVGVTIGVITPAPDPAHQEHA